MAVVFPESSVHEVGQASPDPLICWSCGGAAVGRAASTAGNSRSQFRSVTMLLVTPSVLGIAGASLGQ